MAITGDAMWDANDLTVHHHGFPPAIRSRTPRFRLAIAGLIAMLSLAVAGCSTSAPTLGERLTDAAAARAELAENAVEAERLIERGQKLVVRGRRRIAKGDDEVRKGRALIERGEAGLRQVRREALNGAGV